MRVVWIPLIPRWGKAGSRVVGFVYASLPALSTVPALPKQNVPPRGLCRRLIEYGESKWQEYSKYPPGTIRGAVYRMGSLLASRIPVQESILWRVHQHIEAASSVTMETTTWASQPEQIQSTRHAFKKQLLQIRRHHTLWRWVYGAGIVPVTILTLLPGVKLVLAWMVFRLVGHSRACEAAAWLLRHSDKMSIEASPRLDCLLWGEPDCKDSSGSDNSGSELKSIIDTLRNDYNYK